MDMPEWYKDVCGSQFNELRKNQEEIKKNVADIKELKRNQEEIKKHQEEIKCHVADIREKIFNGMEGRIFLNTKLIILILAGVIFSIATPIILNLL